MIVDNRPGAAGNLGAEIVAKAAPDGHTVLLCVNSYTINTTVYRNLTWDLLRDFAPVGRYSLSPLAVVVNDRVQAKTMAELIAYARANPGKLNYGSAGAGTAPHLAAELFAMQTGVQMVHVPYKGSAPSVTALIAKEVDLSFGALSAFDAVIKDGRARALAVTTAKRSQPVARPPDGERVRRAGLRRRHLVRAHRAGQNAGRGHQEDERRPRPRHGRPGYAVEAPGPRAGARPTSIRPRPASSCGATSRAGAR